MEVAYIPANIGLPDKQVVATVGFFDGVHQGHRFLIEQLQAEAQRQRLPSAVITFPVYPGKVLNPERQLQLLSSFDEKLQLLSATGVDYCYVLDFSIALSRLTAQEFINQTLFEGMRVAGLLVGYDHRFGKDRTESIDEYIGYGQQVGMQVTPANPLLINNEYVSSTRIRKLLSMGSVEEAHQLLSYPYRLTGRVVKGNQIGHSIGFPTANIDLSGSEKIIPAVGCYVVRVYVGAQKHKGMLYIGRRPTIEGVDELRVEVNLLHFSGNLYGQTLTVEFLRFIRNDQKFNSLEELKTQLNSDRAVVAETL